MSSHPRRLYATLTAREELDKSFAVFKDVSISVRYDSLLF